MLHIHHYSRLGGHPGGRKLYATLRRQFYWPSMPSEVYRLVLSCHSCARERIQGVKRSSFLKLFPATAPLQDIAIDILGPLVKANSGCEYLPVITDRYSKLTRAIPMSKISGYTAAKAFCDNWIFVYGPPRSVLSDNGKQFNSKFFQRVCKILGVQNLFTTAYHPQTTGQTERFNRTILSALRHYVADS